MSHEHAPAKAATLRRLVDLEIPFSIIGRSRQELELMLDGAIGMGPKETPQPRLSPGPTEASRSRDTEGQRPIAPGWTVV